MIRHEKNYEAAEVVLSGITDKMTMFDIDLLWCLIVLKRNHGHRIKSAKAIGISLRTFTNYLQALKAHGFEVPKSDRKYNEAKGSVKKNELKKDLNRIGINRKK